MKEIALFVGDVNFQKLDKSVWEGWQDEISLPRVEVMRFEKFIESIPEDEVAFIQTYSPFIMDYIRYMVYKKEVVLSDGAFQFRDERDNIHMIGITADGKYNYNGENYFPSGFHDSTLAKLIEINHGSK